MFLNKEIKLNFQNAKLKVLWKFILKYKHYFIATACLLILAIVLFLTIVYPRYYQNIKLRFIDENTNKPIANTKFRVYRFVYNMSHNSIPPEYLINVIKTDSQGYAHLNIAYIEDKMLLIENKDYITGITRCKSSKLRIKIMNYRYDHRKGIFIGEKIYDLFTGWIVHNKEKIRKYNYITLVCFNVQEAINRRNEHIIDNLLRNVHTIEEFKKRKPVLGNNKDFKFLPGEIIFY